MWKAWTFEGVIIPKHHLCPELNKNRQVHRIAEFQALAPLTPPDTSFVVICGSLLFFAVLCCSLALLIVISCRVLSFVVVCWCLLLFVVVCCCLLLFVVVCC